MRIFVLGAVCLLLASCMPIYRPSACLVDYQVARESGVSAAVAFNDYVVCREGEND